MGLTLEPKRKGYSQGVSYLLVGLMALLAHWPAFRCAVLLTNSDFSLLTMLSQDLLQGKVWIMPPAQHFGGLTLSVFRALWVSVGSLLLDRTIFDPWITFAFTYLALPIGVALLGYHLARALYPPKAAFLTGLAFALGLTGWTVMYGNDFYWGALVLGLIALNWRARAPSPWKNFSPFQLGLAGGLIGLCAYTWRGGLPIVVMLLVPVSRDELSDFRSRIRKVRFVVWGGIIGFFPEIYYQMMNASPSLASVQGDWSTYRQFLSNLRRLPVAFREIVSGSDWTPPVLSLSVPIFVVSLFVFFRASRRNPALRPPALTVLLTMGSFLLISTYAAGAWRYLLPMTPVLVLSIGALMGDRLFASRGKLGLAGIGLLVAGHVVNQIGFLEMVQNQEHTLAYTQQMEQIINRFRQEGIRVALTDNYWHGNTLTLLSGRKVCFVPPGRRHAPQEGYRLIESEEKIGILVSGLTPIEKIKSEFISGVLTGEFLAQIGDYKLFIHQNSQRN